MNTTPSTTLEEKIAKYLHIGITTTVAKAAVHPVFCRLNLHNSKLLKTINRKAKIVYQMAYTPEVLIEAPYEFGGDDNVENALIAIRELAHGDHHGDHKEYIFKRIDFLTGEALHALYDRNHREWVQRIDRAIHEAKGVVPKPVKKVKTVKPVKKTSKKKSVTRLRNKKGQFIKRRRR
jgi:hypothetical protein